MKYLVFDLKLSRDEVLKYYRGTALMVSVRARNGQQVRFPAAALRPFLSHAGVQGTFILYYDEQGKLIQLDRMS